MSHGVGADVLGNTSESGVLRYHSLDTSCAEPSIISRGARSGISPAIAQKKRG